MIVKFFRFHFDLIVARQLEQLLLLLLLEILLFISCASRYTHAHARTHRHRFGHRHGQSVARSRGRLTVIRSFERGLMGRMRDFDCLLMLPLLPLLLPLLLLMLYCSWHR